MSSILINGELHSIHKCPNCKVEHSVPPHLEKAALEQRGVISIYCPNGHRWSFKTTAEMSEEEKVRQERDRLRQQMAEKDDEIARQKDLRREGEKRVIAYKGVVTRTKNRIAGGACPCCNRTFENLHRHMANKHKDYQLKDEVA